MSFSKAKVIGESSILQEENVAKVDGSVRPRVRSFWFRSFTLSDAHPRLFSIVHVTKLFANILRVLKERQV